MRYFRLIDGQYQEQALSPTNPRIWVEELGVGLGLWQGAFEGVPGCWLKLSNESKDLLPN